MGPIPKSWCLNLENVFPIFPFLLWRSVMKIATVFSFASLLPPSPTSPFLLLVWIHSTQRNPSETLIPCATAGFSEFSLLSEWTPELYTRSTVCFRAALNLLHISRSNYERFWDHWQLIRLVWICSLHYVLLFIQLWMHPSYLTFHWPSRGHTSLSQCLLNCDKLGLREERVGGIGRWLLSSECSN